MPTLKQLSVRHPCCDEKLLKKYDSLYQGGQTFRNNISFFLPQNKLEDKSEYDLRVREASYTSYVNSIINTYSAHLFSSPYAIRTSKNSNPVDLDRYYMDLKEDVDLCGTDLTSFFKNKFIEALVKKNSYWLVEFPDDGEPLPENLLDFELRGLNRAYLKSIPTENLINFEIDSFGCFQWAIVHEFSTRQESPFSNLLCVETFKVYQKDILSIYEISYEPQKRPEPETEVKLTAQYVNRFGQVPILGLSLPDGLWLMNQAADPQIEHFRLDVALGWSLRKSAYATLILNLLDAAVPPSPTPFGVALGMEEKASYMEPPCTSMKFLQDQIGKKRDEIYRVSSQMALSIDNSAANIGRSGDSKQADQVATEICLRGYATLVKEAIENTFEFLSNARGDAETKFSIEGMNKFNIVDITTLVSNAAAIKALSIPSETFEKELYKHIVENSLPTDTKQEVKDLIRKEIESANLEALKQEELDNQLKIIGSETESAEKDEKLDGSKSKSAPGKQGKANKFPFTKK